MDPKSVLPSHAMRPQPGKSKTRVRFLLALTALVGSSLGLWAAQLHGSQHEPVKVPLHAAEILDKCRLLNVKPGPPSDFYTRTVSDRFVAGTKPTLIKNATIWTGGEDGLEVISGDVLLDQGLVKGVGSVDARAFELLGEFSTLDAQGAWVTPGIVDMHSHIAVGSSPGLRGAADSNSRKGPILPWLRALDGLNTHDDSYRLSVSGGITTALVLPGSANAIGGQGAVIKLRPTAERSPTSLLLENPYSINTTEYNPLKGVRWRQMKHACGENPDRVYSGTRMDTTWAFREAYETARKIKEEQDEYCTLALAGKWDQVASSFPDNLQWEALVDVLRGRVKVHNHCYEAVDLDDMVRITNEFKFSIAAFHHAHETYLVPGTLKSAYGHPPAAALFATNARFKRESYRGSEFAPRILADNGIEVVMKSDHPVLNSRFLLYEAQQAHHYGLKPNLALLSVTGTPAKVMGVDHRVGFLKVGHDADIVLWDSHPLALGATPQQVWIDGVPQIAKPFVVSKPENLQQVPTPPDFTEEAKEVLDHDGLPPVEPKSSSGSIVIFRNVTGVLRRIGKDLQESVIAEAGQGMVVVDSGCIICSDSAFACRTAADARPHNIVDLEGGWISLSAITYGSPLGLEEISGEASTSDGYVFDPLVSDVPKITSGTLVRAVDGLQYGTRNAWIAYKSGVTVGVVAPKTRGFLAGLSAVFSTGARVDKIVQEVTALHVSVQYNGGAPSVSTQIAALRKLLKGAGQGELGLWFNKATKGEIPLVIEVHSADAMAALLRLKNEIEEGQDAPLRFVFSGAEEAHLLAEHIAEANVGLILIPARPFPHSWEQRRILPGPPLSAESAVSLLLSQNVTVGIGVGEAWEARNARFDAAWAALESGDKISRTEAHALISTNLERLLGFQRDDSTSDLVATRGGGLLDMDSKVIAVISPARGVVDFV